MPDFPSPILFYDGDCGVCNKSVQFVLKHDQNAIFRFATLQGPIAQELVPNYTNQLSTLVIYYPDRIFIKSSGVAHLLKRLGGGWKFLGICLALIPSALRNWGYDFIAKRRKKLGTAYCVVPSPEQRARFLDNQ